MNRGAQVTSIDAIRDFQQELRRYEEVVHDICEALGLEVRRASEWIEHDRTKYWPNAWRKAENQVVAARNELELAKMAAMQQEHKSCIDEKKALERAVHRQRLCEDKVRIVKHWRNKLRHDCEEFRGKMSKLVHYAEVDIPRAIAALDRMIRALDKYTETRSASSTGAGGGVARHTIDPDEISDDPSPDQAS